MTPLQKAAQAALDSYSDVNTVFATIGYMNALRDALVAELLSAALSAPAGWQPIESAPKDHSTLLLWGRYWSEGQGWFQSPLMGRWTAVRDRWECVWGGRWFGVRPTHWMPLPAAPQPQEQT
jgi:hypothetical protein